jgi:hypothetical protein
VADIVLEGEDGRPLADRHARRDAARWALGETGAESLIREARAGRLIAVVGGPTPSPLAEPLEAAGVGVERLAAAPAA